MTPPEIRWRDEGEEEGCENLDGLVREFVHKSNTGDTRSLGGHQTVNSTLFWVPGGSNSGTDENLDSSLVRGTPSGTGAG